MQLYSQKDVDKKALKGARIAVLGYGSQGRAHALNLKDSGFKVVVGVRKGGAELEEGQARRPARSPSRSRRSSGADLVAMLVPDMAQKALYAEIKAQAPQERRRCCSRTASTSTSSRSSRARTSTWC